MLNLYISLIVSVIIYLFIAFGLVFSQQLSQPVKIQHASLRFDSVIETDYTAMPTLNHYEARDGANLAYREYSSTQNTNKILIHGSAWHCMQFHPLAIYLSESGIATVITPDLRGHGFDPKRRGDVDYIGQLEDDMADLIEVIKQQRPQANIILGGHSSGGGLAIRFAGGKHRGLANAYILLAPFLKYNAPTTKPNSGNWAAPLTRRIAGLSMLNKLGIHALNYLKVIEFNMPHSVLDGPYGDSATTAYSYRLNTSFAPRSNYARDLNALTKPFLLLAGNADESFYADQYEHVISKHSTRGTYVLLENVGHIDLLSNKESHENIATWLNKPPDL